MADKVKYHEWIIVENGEGYRNYISVEYVDEDSRIKTRMKSRGESGCAEAVEWWDQRVGEPVKLRPMGKIGYRVYTEVVEETEEEYRLRAIREVIEPIAQRISDVAEGKKVRAQSDGDAI